MNALEQMLDRYLKVPPGKEPAEAPQHFDELARQAPPETVGDGIGEALASDKTPPFPELMRSLFGWGSPKQRIAILKQLAGTMGPGFADSFAGGRLRDVLSRGHGDVRPGAASAQPSAVNSQLGSADPQPGASDPISQIDPTEVETAAKEAERRDPSIVKSMGSMLAQHPDLVKRLGSVALTIAMSKMARRMRH
jgi:hypothetical protein